MKNKDLIKKLIEYPMDADVVFGESMIEMDIADDIKDVIYRDDIEDKYVLLSANKDRFNLYHRDPQMEFDFVYSMF